MVGKISLMRRHLRSEYARNHVVGTFDDVRRIPWKRWFTVFIKYCTGIRNRMQGDPLSKFGPGHKTEKYKVAKTEEVG